MSRAGRRPVAAAAAALIAALMAAAPAAAAPVSVYPTPGTITAGTHTQISFRGVASGDIGEVTVRGSRSGRVRGRLRAHSDGQGASWVPRRDFTSAETVTVRTALDVRGGRSGDFRFRIGRFPDRVTIQKVILENIPPGRTHHFESRPDLQPPVVTVDPGRKATSPGYVFITPKSKKDLKQAGPEIIDNAGQPVWFRPLPGIRAATDFRAQTFRGRPVLTYWEGTSKQGIGVGDMVVLDDSYREIRRIRVKNGFRPDLHEFLLTPSGTALLIAYPAVRWDLRRAGGAPNGLAIDSVIQEIDLDTGLVVFEWHSLGKIPLSESFTAPQPNPAAPWDYVHANSVTLDLNGDLIMSARSTWTAYKIDRETGRIVWRLGGKRSDFKLGEGAHFAWQHDVRRQADGTITVFDNSAFPPVRKRSRAITLRLDTTKRTATLVRAQIHPRNLLVATQGNFQQLPTGGSFVGWGSQRWFTEFGPGGDVLWNARVALGFETYRAFRVPWVGHPTTKPKAAGIRRGAQMDVYASWNGATEVATWEILSGASPDALATVGSGRKLGFETRLRVANRATFVAVRALDASGAVLGTSAPARLH